MPKMIKLTRIQEDASYAPVYLRASHISSAKGGNLGTRIGMLSGDFWYVKETPEQILQLIKEAE